MVPHVQVAWRVPPRTCTPHLPHLTDEPALCASRRKSGGDGKIVVAEQVVRKTKAKVDWCQLHGKVRRRSEKSEALWRVLLFVVLSGNRVPGEGESSVQVPQRNVIVLLTFISSWLMQS
ncbi:hypothetical protein BaRGS_00001776 [Batillaria attramentaria]|uniref:Uncharacterized protein n=1 Tax=Batillaria attramentaria TaxID=370345 RepID=A0ABD0M5W9_9CAEN